MQPSRNSECVRVLLVFDFNSRSMPKLSPMVAQQRQQCGGERAGQQQTIAAHGVAVQSNEIPRPGPVCRPTPSAGIAILGLLISRQLML
jgi:hypothetical protein